MSEKVAPGEPPAAAQPATDGIALIAAERARQQAVEGWTPAHDDYHADAEMIEGARAYLSAAVVAEIPRRWLGPPPPTWPWNQSWWKPSDDPIRNLVKAGALIAAEIDRLQRASEVQPPAAVVQPVSSQSWDVATVEAELSTPGYSIISGWLAIHGGMSAQIVKEELAQMVNRARAADLVPPPAAVVSPTQPTDDEDVSDRYDLGYKHGWKDGYERRSSVVSPTQQTASWPYAPNELCPKCGVVLPCHAHQIPHPRASSVVSPREEPKK